MKKITSIFMLLFAIQAYAVVDSTQLQIQAFENSMQYQTGKVEFPSCHATLNTPKGFRFLNAEQSQMVLSQIWGNPEDSSVLGFLVPENTGVLDSNNFIFVLSFEKIGYVKDDDAEDIDYDELLKELQKESAEANPERIKLGYEPMEFIGWASKPFYDSDKKILHWAKELKFGESTVNTLNYNLRILGKNGVFVLNAISTMNELGKVQPHIDNVINSVEFEKGNTYSDFDPDVDEVAAWTVGGLVAGKVLAKVGFWAVIAKFSKVIFFGLIAAAGAAWKFFTGKKKEPNKPNDSTPSSSESIS